MLKIGLFWVPERGNVDFSTANFSGVKSLLDLSKCMPSVSQKL